MAITKLKGYKHGKKCESCKRLAKYKVDYSTLKGLYCKKCYKKWCKLRHKEKEKRPPKKNTYKGNERTVTQRIMNLRRRATPSEKCFLEKMKEVCPVKFKFQRGFVKGGYYAIVDFHIPSRNICIEIDGGYHENPEQQKKDVYRDNWLTKVRRQTVKRITNKQAFDMPLGEVLRLCQKE